MSAAEVRTPTQQDLHEILESVRLETRVPGLGAAVSVGGTQVLAYAGQPAPGLKQTFSERSRFEMSCLMKLFMSLTVLELNGEGVLDIAAPVQEYLPEFPRVGRSAQKLCVHHLMNHTGGYRGVDISTSQVRWNYSWERFLEHCATPGRHFTPGSVFNYEHSEHVILGEIVRRICGPGSRVQERVFEPLNIHPSCVRSDWEQGEPYVGQHTYSATRASFESVSLPGFGPFWSASLPDATLTLKEMLTVGEALLEDRQSGRNSGIFSKSTRASLRSAGQMLPVQVAAGVRSEQMPMSFGLGFGHYRGGVLGHNGSMFGQTCTLRIDPSREVAIAVGVNAWVPYARDSVVSRTLTLIAGVGDTVDPSPAALDKAPFRLEQLINGFSLQEIAGRYVGSYCGEVHVSHNDGAVHFDLGAAGRKQTRISALADAPGYYRIDSPVPVLAAFFGDPDESRTPALMMGLHAYKKSS